MPDDQNWPTHRKEMVVARPIGTFTNGRMEGVLDKKVIGQLIANFQRHKVVPVFLWGHVEDLDERPPDGWVEGLRANERGELVADVKIHGEAVGLVERDQIRSASIAWSSAAKDYQGEAIGAVLRHVTLTNNPYIKDMPSIAAARHQGGEPLLVCFTALPEKEARVADETKPDTKDEEIKTLRAKVTALEAQTPDQRLTQKLTDTQALLEQATREVAELTATNANLRGDVERAQENPQMEKALKTIAEQELQLTASKIRRLVKDGVAAGQLSVGQVGEPKKGYDHQSDMQVLNWFKQSELFKGDINNLEFALRTFPKQTLNRTFQSGAPKNDSEITLDEATKAHLRKLGQDPDRVLVAMKNPHKADYDAALSTKES